MSGKWRAAAEWALWVLVAFSAEPCATQAQQPGGAIPTAAVNDSSAAMPA